MSYLSVTYKRVTTVQVSSTPALIFGSELVCIIDSIVIVNTVNNDFLLDMTILSETDDSAEESYLIKQLPIMAYGKQEVINTNFQNNVGISTTDTHFSTVPGDTIFASSDYVGSLFDCHVCYRELVSSGGLSGVELQKYADKIKDHKQLSFYLKENNAKYGRK